MKNVFERLFSVLAYNLSFMQGSKPTFLIILTSSTKNTGVVEALQMRFSMRPICNDCHKTLVTKTLFHIRLQYIICHTVELNNMLQIQNIQQRNKTKREDVRQYHCVSVRDKLMDRN